MNRNKIIVIRDVFPMNPEKGQLVYSETTNLLYIFETQWEVIPNTQIDNLPVEIKEILFEDLTPDNNLLHKIMKKNKSNFDKVLDEYGVMKILYRNPITRKEEEYYFELDYTSNNESYTYSFNCLTDISKSFYIQDDEPNDEYIWHYEHISNCLTGNTIVYTNTGMKYIKDLSKGEKILSYNTEKHIPEFKTINNISSHYIGIIYRIELDDDIIKCTFDEPFYMSNMNVVKCQNIGIRDKFYGLDGNVEVLRIQKKEERHLVYDLTIQDNYNYFIGKSSILVQSENI